MNHGLYEIIDRISIIQNTLEDNVRRHQEADEHLQQLIDSAQEKMYEAYNYAGVKWDESCRDIEEGYE